MKLFSPSITGSLTLTGSVVITGSFNVQPGTPTDQVFLVKGYSGNTLLIVSQSGVVQFATQSVDPTGTTNAGTIWFTSASFFVGLE